MIRTNVAALAAIVLVPSALAATPTLSPAPQRVALADDQWYTEGSFLPYASGWCSYIDGTLKAGSTYSNGIAFTKGQLPNDVTFTWRYPAKQAIPACGVYGMDYLAWGNYVGGAVATPVQPRTVAAITDLTVTYAASFDADPESGDGLVEFYLTRQQGKADPRAIEIGAFWHVPAATRAFMKMSAQQGVFTDRFGRRWTVAQSRTGAAGNFVMFAPVDGKDVSAGSIDLKGELDYLVARQLVMPYWWFNGLGFGVEPQRGAGTMRLRSLAVSYR